MKAIIMVDVPEHQIGQEVSVYFKDSMCVKSVCKSFEAIEELINCSIDTLCQKYLTPIPDNATNGQVLLQMFPPSVYFGDDEKHIVLLTKDCELTCYNNEWWNAPYKVEREE